MAKHKVTLVLDDLTMEDVEAFEDATGLSLYDELAPKPVIDQKTGMPVKDPDDDKGRPLLRAKLSARAHIGLIYLGLRRHDPSVDFDNVRRMRIKDIDFDLQSGDDSPLDETGQTGDAGA